MNKNDCGSQYDLGAKEHNKIQTVDTVTILYKDFLDYERKSMVLDALIAHGVENWEGYDEAMESLK